MFPFRLQSQSHWLCKLLSSEKTRSRLISSLTTSYISKDDKLAILAMSRRTLISAGLIPLPEVKRLGMNGHSTKFFIRSV